jgi:hypothetical protein
MEIRVMIDIRIKLSVLWICLMLIYLLGDVLRLFSGDVKPGDMMGMKVTQAMWMGMAALMLIPILMAWFNLTIDRSVIRWANIIVAAFWFLFNLVGLPTYPSAYDKFLLAVSLVFNVATIWYAWGWV